MTNHVIVSEQDWIEARKKLLAEEKAFTRQRDALSARRRQLPWVRVEKSYTFEGPAGRVSLADLFGPRSQLIVYHFMFGPDWEVACKSCSFWADNFNGIVDHLAQRDVSFVAISRAPLAKLRAFADRLGWSFPWFSSLGSDFNFDYQVSFDEAAQSSGEAQYNFAPAKVPSSEMPGISVFFKDDGGAVYRTYSCYSRGLDMLNGAYHYLDLVPKGRDEDALDYTMAWLKIRDEYSR